MHKIKLDDGKYKYVESYIGLDGKRHRVSVTKSNQTRATEKQAYEELQEKINEKLKKNSNKSLNFYIKEYIEFKRGAVANHTLKQIENYLSKVSSDTLIYNLNKNDLEKQLNELRKDLSPSTILVTKSAINSLFKYISEYHDSNFNLYLKFRYTKEDRVKEKMKKKYIETSELKKVLESIDHELTRDFVTIQAHTGLRIGELLAITPQDVDFKKNTLKITKTRNRKTISSPKTANSVRKIEISNLVKDLLLKYVTSSNLIFNISKEVITSNLQKLKLKSHMFRHTHVALLIEAGVPIKVISERLGHSDIITTLNIYSHVTKNMKIDLEEKLEKLGTF